MYFLVWIPHPLEVKKCLVITSYLFEFIIEISYIMSSIDFKHKSVSLKELMVEWFHFIKSSQLLIVKSREYWK